MLALQLRKKCPELGVLAGLGLGAGLMYFADPERGHRRRIHARDKINWAIHHGEKAVDRSFRDLTNRVHGLIAQVVGAVLPERIPDEVLVDRVRARLGRLVCHPGAIDVNVADGRVILKGDVLAQDFPRLLRGVGCMAGVREVIDNVNVHAEPADVPALQGKQTVTGECFELLRPRWTPATRVVIGLGGLGLMVLAARRRGLLGAGLGLVGSGMFFRSVTNIGPVEGIGLDRHAPGITLQKTAVINAPVKRVFELLMDPEKLPRVLDHVEEVKKVDEKHYHWTVRGPGGAPLSWDSEITQIVPNEMLAWASSPGAVVKNAGVVQFEPTGDGGTRVHIRMRYMPPGGFLGHTVAELLDADPKHMLDRDLVRLKSLVERGKTTIHHHHVKIEDLEDEK